jgi:hypothetical protein
MMAGNKLDNRVKVIRTERTKNSLLLHGRQVSCFNTNIILSNRIDDSTTLHEASLL